VIPFNLVTLAFQFNHRQGAGMLKVFTLLLSVAPLMLAPEVVSAIPNGTWLSKPQIWYFTSTHQIERVMTQIRLQQYKVVFLDYRKVSEQMQQKFRKKRVDRG
jgi:hypothetical protein